MIKLLPNSSNQIISIVPREFPSFGVDFDNISLLIKEDGTGIEEELTNLEATVSSENSNYVNIGIPSIWDNINESWELADKNWDSNTILFSILREGYGYYLEFRKGGVLWFRDKAYITSQTDKAIKHTINTNEYEQYSSVDEDYIIL